MFFKRKRTIVFSVFLALGLIVSLAVPSFSMISGDRTITPPFNSAQLNSTEQGTQFSELFSVAAIQQGQAFYEAGRYAEAIESWTLLLEHYQQNSDELGEASVWSYLALAYQGLGQWEQALNALSMSLEKLPDVSDQALSTEQIAVQAQVLNNQGNLQLHQGNAADALANWQEAERLYQRVGGSVEVVQAQLNQAEALYDLGFYRQAITLLTDLLADTQVAFDDPSSSVLETVALRRLGNLLRMVGQLDESEQSLERSLAIAQRLADSEEVGETLISLGHTARAQNDMAVADTYYQQATELPIRPETRLRTQLAQMSLWVSMEQSAKVLQLWPSVLASLDELPATHTSIYGRIHLVKNLVQLRQVSGSNLGNSGTGELSLVPDEVTLAPILVRALQQARETGDRSAESYALGSLGELYERTRQWESATEVTRRALGIAQTLNAPELVYPWEWQLGRIFKQQGKQAAAITAYSDAVTVLKSIRGDLAAVDSEVQFSFQESVEPIYRELVSLLLQPDAQQVVSQSNLEKARDTIESLHLAELDDFFKEACLDVQPVQIDEVDAQAAIFYPILLDDRLAVILRLPGQPLQSYTTPIDRSSVEALTEQLRQSLVIRSRRDYLPLSQQLYDWLLRPVARDLRDSGVETLVFVLDRALQNVPMATLHDGQHFLIEDYGVALTPGLKLLSPQPIDRQSFKVLAAGLSEGRQGFSPLSHVESEIEAIQAAIEQKEVLLNQSFTSETLVDELKNSSFPIVHIATHGQFSSTVEDTFLLSWDDRINVAELDQALYSGAINRETAIELLVLSACQTASGNKRASLGLAGTAVKAGARSTIATLWSVNDEATADLVGYFYRALVAPGATKAQALRQAQLQLLRSPQYRHPVYWAPYILLGNWL